MHKAVVVNEWRVKILMEIDKSCPHCGPQSVESVEHRFYRYPLAQHWWRCVATSFGNSSPKMGILAHGSPFLCYNVYLINLCAKDLNNSVVSGSSYEVVFHGSSGSNGMIWFLTIYNYPLRKHAKSFGMPYRIMGGVNGNKLSGTWKKPQT